MQSSHALKYINLITETRLEYKHKNIMFEDTRSLHGQMRLNRYFKKFTEMRMILCNLSISMEIFVLQINKNMKHSRINTLSFLKHSSEYLYYLP
jgi:hypothetical protein